MENASKALIMAAEVLVGVMIISIGVYIFNVMGNYSAETAEKIEETRIASFNEQFLKYYGTTSTDGNTPTPIKCTIHDIIGLANLANKTNQQNDLAMPQEKSDNTMYIQIELKAGSKTYKNLEAKSESELIEIVKNNSIINKVEGTETKAEIKYFKCTEVGFGKNTKLVNYMKFEEI